MSVKDTRIYKTSSYKRGFTLIEVLIVTGILALLLVTGLVFVTPSINRGRDGRRKADLQKISNYLEEYYSDNNSYPATADMAECDQDNVALEPYISRVPCDINTSNAYLYIAVPQSGGTCSGSELSRCSGYRLLTDLAHNQDEDIKKKGCTKDFGGQPGCHQVSGKVYDYGIAVGTELRDP